MEEKEVRISLGSIHGPLNVASMPVGMLRSGDGVTQVFLLDMKPMRPRKQHE